MEFGDVDDFDLDLDLVGLELLEELLPVVGDDDELGAELLDDELFGYVVLELEGDIGALGAEGAPGAAEEEGAEPGDAPPAPPPAPPAPPAPPPPPPDWAWTTAPPANRATTSAIEFNLCFRIAIPSSYK